MPAPRERGVMSRTGETGVYGETRAAAAGKGSSGRCF